MTSKGLPAKPPAQGQAVAEHHEVFDTRRVVTTLENLMTRVTEEKVTPDTVNAACNCANKIVDILRLHLDVERLKQRTPKSVGGGDR